MTAAAGMNLAHLARVNGNTCGGSGVEENMGTSGGAGVNSSGGNSCSGGGRNEPGSLGIKKLEELQWQKQAELGYLMFYFSSLDKFSIVDVVCFCRNFDFNICYNVQFGNGLALCPIMERFNSLMVAGKKDSVDVIEYHLLEFATNNFGESNVLGDQGGRGRGRVYKARFNEKFLAAVKTIEGGGPDAQREFEVILFL
ncbi:hypothetical protein ACOSP7_015775 [Xanthoceras sorbifolium]